MSTTEFVQIKDLKPGMKNINAVFIVLEVGPPTLTKEAREVRTLRVADASAMVNFSVWDEPGALLQPGDIVRLTRGYASLWRSALTLYSGKSGDIQKVGEFCMIFNEQVNMSEPQPAAPVAASTAQPANERNGNGTGTHSGPRSLMPNAAASGQGAQHSNQKQERYSGASQEHPGKHTHKTYVRGRGHQRGNIVATAASPAHPAPAPTAPTAQPRLRLPRSTSNSWLQLVADYARNNMEFGADGPQWSLPGVTGARGPLRELVALLAARAPPQPAILPLLVLPMEVPAQPPPPQPVPECPVVVETTHKENVKDNFNRKRVSSNGFNDLDEEYPPGRSRGPQKPDLDRERPTAEPSYEFIPEVNTGPPPTFNKVVSSQKLVDMFRSQTPSAPYEPPMKLSGHDLSERAPPPQVPEPQRYRRQYAAPAPGPAAGPAPSAAPTVAQYAARQRAPPRPRFDRPLLLRGQLTVPRADYSEPYTVWWDAQSGDARVDHHGGAASTFRTIADSNVYRVETHVDRSGERPLRRCAVGSAERAAPEDRTLPVLPAELDQFVFSGYVESGRGRGEGGGVAELWQRVVAGRAGEAGGARSEALTARHDLVLARDGDRLVPLSYTVSVNSSLLGPDCDGYHHQYIEVTEQQHMPNEACDQVEYVNASAPDPRARLDPLREFTLPRRDPRYDLKFTEFVRENERRYADGAEEAVRKNLLVQSHRFVSSGNRQGATAQLGVNFLCDRLDAELAELRGVQPAPELRRAERFPHPRRQLAAAEDALPRNFDWRPRGAVTPVRYQGQCMSCWAFAVTGAVEGALFLRTRRLVPLSEKCLVDCAHTHGANGCGGTWPSRAYDYIRDRGLPALDEFTPYEPKVDTCARKEPVTRISGHVNVTVNSVPALKVAIRRHAPTVVIVDATAKSFTTYSKGVLYDDRCGKSRRPLNHAVLAVGWGEKRGEPHFILKNSWSTAWGEGGYVRVQARGNTCGVLSQPSYPRLEREDVLRTPSAAPAAPAAPAAAQPAEPEDV
ncbi:Digestive cysteine proteinase 1 [Papilio xuthus]|uniref:Digestive cysteine proteinase 1 n=1 Tax=Papilio xuthus TaxID=66420 RepID=A0A0N1I3Y8_PAPXU|nr:Digestive cysteine proteinase 1 [Papilio xuthus]